MPGVMHACMHAQLEVVVVIGLWSCMGMAAMLQRIARRCVPHAVMIGVGAPVGADQALRHAHAWLLNVCHHDFARCAFAHSMCATSRKPVCHHV